MNLPHHITRTLWVPLLTCIVLIPVIAWVQQAPFEEARSSFPLFMKLLGQISGIIGAQLFSFALLLSARLKTMEFFFGGLDRMYSIHHRVGVIAFSFLAVHPLLLALRFLPDSFEDAMMFLLPSSATLAKNFGIISLLIMLTLLTLTFYGAKFSYPALKSAHRFLGLAFFLGLLHMFLIPSTISENMVIKFSCLGMASVGILAFVYRTLLGKFLVPRFVYSVSHVSKRGEGVTEILLSPVKQAMSHLPGQFAMLSFVNAKGISQEEHPFTISSSDKSGKIRFSIKSLGDYTSLLSSLTEGVKANIEGPFGEFSYVHGTSSQIWVAGGIGVTPFVSMAEDLLGKDSIAYTIDFFYSVRSEKDAVYQETFSKLATKHPNFTFHLMPSDVSGFVTGEGIVKEVTDAVERDFYICGPPLMMSALTDQLIAVKVPKHAIHTERFALLK